MEQTSEECKSEVDNVLKRSKSPKIPFINKKLAISQLESKGTAKEVLSKIHEDTQSELLLQHNSLEVARHYFRDDDDHAGPTRGKILPIRVEKESVVKTLDSVHLTMHNCFAKNVNVSANGARHTTNSLLQPGKEKDMTVAKALFPDFFPRQQVQDSYDSLRTHPTLEQIFSGQIKPRRERKLTASDWDKTIWIKRKQSRPLGNLTLISSKFSKKSDSLKGVWMTFCIIY